MMDCRGRQGVCGSDGDGDHGGTLCGYDSARLLVASPACNRVLNTDQFIDSGRQGRSLT